MGSVPALADEYDRLVEQAQAARQEGNFLEAAALLERAHALKPIPVLLNNIGKMYEVAGVYRKAYNAYKRVADDPNADSALRNLDSQRMANLQPKLSQGHFVIKTSETIKNLWLGGERVDRSTFNIEQRRPPGSHKIEIQMPKQTVFGTINLKTARRTTLNLDDIVGKAHGQIVGLSVAGLKSISIDGYTVRTDLKLIETINLAPEVYDVGLSFTDGSRYESVRKVAKGKRLDLNAYASNFARTEEGFQVGGATPKHLWIKSTAVALGVGLTTAGGFMSVNAREDADRVFSNSEITMFDAQSRWNEARSDGERGVMLMSVGLTAITGGVLWLLLDERSSGGSSAWEFGPSLPLQPVFGTQRPLTATTSFGPDTW